jgi:cytochrome d ubiquinol oxidase subunit I
VVRGLKEWPKEDRPPVALVFFAFRIMVAIGFAMLGLILLGWILHWRNRLYTSPWFLRLCEFAMPLGFIAILAGWTTTEVGRQPWTVYGLMRTADSVTPSLTAFDVMLSLALYIVVYLMVYPVALMFIVRLVRAGPAQADAMEAPVSSGRPRQPVEALPGAPTGRT